jgi:hypothetical protein
VRPVLTQLVSMRKRTQLSIERENEHDQPPGSSPTCTFLYNHCLDGCVTIPWLSSLFLRHRDALGVIHSYLSMPSSIPRFVTEQS